MAEAQTGAARRQPVLMFGVGAVLGAVVLLAVLAGLGVVRGCSRPVAKVGGKTISEDELRSEMQALAGQQVLDGLIRIAIVEEGFKLSGLTITPQELDERMAQLIQEMGGPDRYEASLAREGYDDARIRRVAEATLQMTKLQEQMADLHYTDEDLRKYFAEHKAAFSVPAKVQYGIIVVGSREEAEDIRRMALKPGASFPDLSVKYSIDPEARNRRGEFEVEVKILETHSPDLLQELHKLQAGEISKPLSPGGGQSWVLLKLKSFTPEQPRKFEDVRELVERQYKALRLPDQSEVMAKLQQKVAVRILQPEYQSLQGRYMRPETGVGPAPPSGPAQAGKATRPPAPPESGQTGAPAPQGKAGG